MSTLTPESAELRVAIWNEISGKAHLYETAYDKATLDPVKILGLRSPGVFVCRLLGGMIKDFGCEELTHYCL